MVGLVISLCFINIVLWVVFLINFKRLFSTDKIIEKTTDQMNKLVAEIDNTTERDLYLIDERTKKLKELLAQTETQMEMYKTATQRLREMIAETDKISRSIPKTSPLYDNVTLVPEKKSTTKKTNPSARNTSRNIEKYLQNSAPVDKTVANPEEINPDDVFKVVKPEQQDLFNNDESDFLTDTPMQVTDDGAAFREVPLIITKIYQEKPAEAETGNGEIPDHIETKSRKNNRLSRQVQELYSQGMDAEHIANELSCSITEVELIIEMNT